MGNFQLTQHKTLTSDLSNGTKPPLKKSAVFEIVFNDDVCNRVHHKLDVARVRSTREMCVDVFRSAVTVQTFKPCSDVRTGLIICITT